MFNLFKAAIFGSLVIAMLTAVGCSKPAAKPTAANSEPLCNAKVLNSMGLKMLWERRLPISNGDRIFKITPLGDNIYYSTEHRILVSATSSTGNPTWAVKVAQSDEKVFGPSLIENVQLSETPLPPSKSSETEFKDLIAYNIIIVNTPTKLLAIDSKKGKIVRQIALPFAATSAAGFSGKMLELSDNQKTINEINLLFGAVGQKKYTGLLVKTPIKSQQDHFILAGADGKVASYTSKGLLARNWSFDVQGEVTTPFITNYRGVFIASGDKRIYGLDVATGQRLWTPARIGGKFAGPMVADDERLYQFASGKGLVAVSLDSGKVEWTVPQGLLVLGSFNGKVFVLTRGKDLLAVDKKTGEVIGSSSLKKFDRFAVNATKEAIYAATADGTIIAIAPSNAKDVTLEMLRK